MAYKYYTKFREKFRHIHLLHQIERLLAWDQRTFLPGGAVNIRSHQISYMATLAHEASTSIAYQRALEKMIDIEAKAIKIDELSAIEQANVKIWARDFKRAVKLPKDFVKKYALLVSTATEEWKKTKNAANFSLFSPFLQQIVKLNQEKARLLGFSESPYDALIDLYEPEVTTSSLATLFADMGSFLSSFLKEKEVRKKLQQPIFDRTFDQVSQMHFNKLLLDTIGIPTSNCRIDVSDHPFCVGTHPYYY